MKNGSEVKFKYFLEIGEVANLCDYLESASKQM